MVETRHPRVAAMRHRFHAICPYFAMFPETFAAEWIDRLTQEGDTILDPFCGRGTAPFQALLMRRRAVGIDVNPVAYCVTRAKTNAPELSRVHRRLEDLRGRYRPARGLGATESLPQFFREAYHPATLAQLVWLREELRWRESDVDCMITAVLLGILHGESARSPSYLSNQMPRTISTKPGYSMRFWRERQMIAPVRDAFDLVDHQLAYRYASPIPSERALVFNADMRELPRLLRKGEAAIRCVITSPPYLDVTSFEEDQWLRLWFLGGPPRPTKGVVSRDDRLENVTAYWRMIADMWRCLGQVLSVRSHVVIRIGTRRMDPDQLAAGVKATAVVSGRRTSLLSVNVSEIRRRQTDAFRPGAPGCLREVDCHLAVK